MQISKKKLCEHLSNNYKKPQSGFIKNNQEV